MKLFTAEVDKIYGLELFFEFQSIIHSIFYDKKIAFSEAHLSEKNDWKKVSDYL